MTTLILELFVSLVIGALTLILLAYSIKHRDGEHADRLSLLPLDEEPTSDPAKSCNQERGD